MLEYIKNINVFPGSNSEKHSMKLSEWIPSMIAQSTGFNLPMKAAFFAVILLFSEGMSGADVWDWWCIEGVRWHGHDMTVLFDRNGTHYGKGKGLVILGI